MRYLVSAYNPRHFEQLMLDNHLKRKDAIYISGSDKELRQRQLDGMLSGRYFRNQLVGKFTKAEIERLVIKEK